MRFSILTRLLTVLFVLVGIIAAMLVYMVCWKPGIFHVDRNHLALNRTTIATTPAMAPSTTPSPHGESDYIWRQRNATHTTTARTLRTIVATIPTGPASTSTEALHIAKPTHHIPAGHQKRDSVAASTPRGIFAYINSWNPSSTPASTPPPCSGKPYTPALGFALAHPNNTLLGGGNYTTTPVFYISTRWHITYPYYLAKAVLNDPLATPECPSGHCYSVPIPGSGGLRLVRLMKPLEDETWCYHTMQYSVEKLGVQLGKTNRLHGEEVRDEAVPLYVATQRHMIAYMETTYPFLEIGLILGCTLGLFVVVSLLTVLGSCVLVVVAKGLKKLGAAGKKFCSHAGSQCKAVGAWWRRCRRKIRIRQRGMPAAVGEEWIHGAELKDVLGAPPPPYEQAIAYEC